MPAYVPLSQARASVGLGASTTSASSSGASSSPLQQARQAVLQKNTTAPKPTAPVKTISTPVAKPTPQPSFLQQTEGVFKGAVGAVGSFLKQPAIQSGIKQLTQAGVGTAPLAGKIPEAHFADTISQYTPKGFKGNATALGAGMAQGAINTPAESQKGAASLNKHIQDGNSTPQQVAGDLAAVVQLPLLFLGGESSLVKGGMLGAKALEGGAKQYVIKAGKAVVTNAIDGGSFGVLSGLQSGKDINNLSDYLKNMVKNIEIGAGMGAGIGSVTHVVIPLAKGIPSKMGAVFVKNVNTKPTVSEIHLDPQAAQSMVLANDMEKTPVGKAIVKESLVAKEQGAHVAITPKSNGKYTLPDGKKVDINTVAIYDPHGQADAAALTKEPLAKTGSGGTSLPLSSDAVINPSLPKNTENVSPSKVYLPGTKADEVLSDEEFINHYNHITSKKETLAGILKSAADGRETIHGVKDMKTAAEKVAGKLAKHPEFNETHLNDLVRGTIVAKSDADKATVLENLKKHANVIEVDDHSAKGNAWGYEGVNVTIKTSDGHLNEVQIHTGESMAIQNATHTLYEKWRRGKVPPEVLDESKKIADKARQEYRAKQDIKRVITEDKPIEKHFDVKGKEIVAPTKGKPLTGKQVEQIREVVRARLDVARGKATSPQDFAKHVDAVVKDVMANAGNDKMVLSALRTEINKEWEAIGGGGNYLDQARTIHIIRENDSDMAHLIDNLDTHKQELDKKLLEAQKPERGIAKAPAALERARQDGKPTVAEPVGTGSPKQSRAYKRLVDHLAETDPELFNKVKDDPKLMYNTVNQKYDFENAAKIVETDPDKAYRIAKQMEAAPVGQRWESVNIVLADRALAEKNIPLWKDLEQSRSFAQTRAGQGIVAEKGRFDDTSPHTYVQQVLDARLKKLGSNPITAGIDMTMKMLKKESMSRKENAMIKIDRAVTRAKEFTKQERSKIEFAQNLLDQLTCK